MKGKSQIDRNQPGERISRSYAQIPEHLLEWFVSARRRITQAIGERKPVSFFSAHLPVMVTWSDQASFPVNMAVKGIGLIPKTTHLQGDVEFLENTVFRAEKMI